MLRLPRRLLTGEPPGKRLRLRGSPVVTACLSPTSGLVQSAHAAMHQLLLEPRGRLSGATARGAGTEMALHQPALPRASCCRQTPRPAPPRAAPCDERGCSWRWGPSD